MTAPLIIVDGFGPRTAFARRNKNGIRTPYSFGPPCRFEGQEEGRAFGARAALAGAAGDGIAIVRVMAVAVILAMAGFAVTAEAKKKPRETWSVSRSSDPITGDTSCVVTAFDQAAGMKFSRVGYLYPIIELNAKMGLLVGVSSGGRFRLPTGDILWRVDDRSHRELKAADNPASSNVPYAAAYKTGNDVADQAVVATMAQTSSLVASMTATSTVASGDTAKEMLAEMLAGQSLIFRQASAAPVYGLPTYRTVEVGQITKDGHKPIPLDESFRRSLAECGINNLAG